MFLFFFSRVLFDKSMFLPHGTGSVLKTDSVSRYC